MTRVLVIGCADGQTISTATAEAISVGRKLGQTLFAALIGSGVEEAARELAGKGLDQVVILDDARLAGPSTDAFVAAAEVVVNDRKPDLVIIAGMADGQDWAARLAICLDAAFAPNCVSLAVEEGRLVATRAVCGGSLLADYAFERPLAIATLVPGCAEPEMAAGQCDITRLSMPKVEGRVELLEVLKEDTGDGPPLKQAKTVVSGGLGLGSRENFAALEKAAASLGAAVGASRAAVEIGWAPASRQVGFSGQKVSPDLYIAAGISGAVHHLAGISGAKTVIAINTDPEAPIFKHARYGIVGDAVDVLTAFAERVKDLRG